jgi:hypothetical protein
LEQVSTILVESYVLRALCGRWGIQCVKLARNIGSSAHQEPPLRPIELSSLQLVPASGRLRCHAELRLKQPGR